MNLIKEHFSFCFHFAQSVSLSQKVVAMLALTLEGLHFVDLPLRARYLYGPLDAPVVQWVASTVICSPRLLPICVMLNTLTHDFDEFSPTFRGRNKFEILVASAAAWAILHALTFDFIMAITTTWLTVCYQFLWEKQWEQYDRVYKEKRALRRAKVTHERTPLVHRLINPDGHDVYPFTGHDDASVEDANVAYSAIPAAVEANDDILPIICIV
jgi:hypothetical protein